MQTTFLFSFLFCVCLVEGAFPFGLRFAVVLKDLHRSLIDVSTIPQLSRSQQKSAFDVMYFVAFTMHDVRTTLQMSQYVKVKKLLEVIARVEGLEQKLEAAAGQVVAREGNVRKLRTQISEKEMEIANWVNLVKLEEQNSAGLKGFKRKMASWDRKVTESKISKLKAQVAIWKRELVNEEGMLKLAKLKKELSDKRLSLKGLLAEHVGGKQFLPPQEEEVKQPKSKMAKNIQAAGVKLRKVISNASKSAEDHADTYDTHDSTIDPKQPGVAEKSSQEIYTEPEQDMSTRIAQAKGVQGAIDRMIKNASSANGPETSEYKSFRYQQDRKSVV